MTTDNIKIYDLLTFSGRNIYSHRPMMKMIIDIGRYEDIPTKDIEGFNERLLKAFPGLKTNCCGLGYEGGFLDRLKEGTYIGHVLEHVILEMQSMLGYDVRYGKTRLLEKPSIYYLVYEFVNEVCGLESGKAAVFILNCFLNGEDIEVKDFLNYLRKISIEAELGPSTGAIVAEAKRREIPITRIGNESLVQLGYGKYRRIIESTLTDATSCISADISCNKQLTKFILSEHHIPVPYGKVVYSEISALIAAKQIGFPVVLKPFDGNQGKGVFLNLNSEEDIKKAFKEACNYSNGIIIEKFISGRDFRILVVGGKVSAVSERLPAMVTGDGEHTIKELVDFVNEDENRGEHHEKPLTKIRIDNIAMNLLEINNMTLNYVPKSGEIVKLRANGNLSTGGTAIDCTDIIHPENVNLAVQAAEAIGIDIAGIDMVSPDISKSILETEGAIVEVNTAPGIRMHIYPSQGQSRDVAKDIVDHLFPNEESYRFPIVSVTGTNGKTTTVRLISHVLSLSGKNVGHTCTSGTYISGKCIFNGDHSGPRSARALLSDKSIDSAVLETARGGIIREGLGYDLADVGVVVNIAEDHLGMDGVKTLEELAFVKSVVTEAVKASGYAVFNADDDMTPYLIKRTHAKIVLFSKQVFVNEEYNSEDIVKVFVDNGCITVKDKDRTIPIVPVSEIPITLGGKIECNIENSLAAVSALYALSIPTDIISAGLKTFEHNIGRFNIYSINGMKIILDYGHNLPGFEQVIKSCKNIGFKRLIGVIGMPGDRSDASVKSVGEFCAGEFDKIYIKEDMDKRGREQGEIAELFKKYILAENFSDENLVIILNELSALKKAIEEGTEGDLIVVFYETLKPLQDYLSLLGAKPEN